ncbi:MAG: ParB/RepB/Spo0J family partition protein [Clostridia bacterium]|nr:ParB/RepB/Spo0J family partition protein [Clostridia bacterium]
MARKSGLGRGYSALLNDNATDENSAVEVRLSDIEPNRDQPRKHFDQAALDELSDNIAQYGLLQPIVVRPLINGGYQIVAGERRWRACRQAGLTTVPVVIKELSDEQTMEIALIENLQREDLNPIEEAQGYKQLMTAFGMTQEEVSKKVGKSRSAVANSLRLLELEEYIDLIAAGVISAGHGRALLALSPEDRAFAVEFIKKGASVRDIEQMGKKAKANAKSATAAPVKIPYYSEVELALKEELGRRVKVQMGKTKGTLEIEFYGEQDLADLIEMVFNK